MFGWPSCGTITRKSRNCTHHFHRVAERPGNLRPYRRNLGDKLRHAIPLAIALRQSLSDLASSHRAKEGQRSKMEMVCQYLTGPHFRHRIEAIIEKFTDMQVDLDRERKP